ncbi:hypothetical protein K504DRAFT_530379 [Pleomassaria siparia CBS 279.74]|uniref:ABM domain-containing protein n=1 Tax=Pleomassaria siparia CBS 279.74 TaxID=1314801 RepID=A0A6G1KKM9_9PLEO|nr:hypothetical protein K504DRAFT_530379 [Pleomassaria siparia CBS 279.74]
MPPITELVIGAFRPEVAKEGLALMRSSVPKYFHPLPGILLQRVGHMVEHNGEDISGEYRSLLFIEWETPEDFHNFYPKSKAFGEFVATVGEYLGGKPTPRLFQPVPEHSRSNATLQHGVTQIFTGRVVGGKQDETSGAWKKLVEAVKEEEKGDLKEWSGWGIEDADGVWTGLLGWESVETHEAVTAKKGVVEAIRALKEQGDFEDFVVTFQE